ncbi:MAG TPA: HEAT repeat domain-containing protein [Verrucomicrobiae bacterium]|nr:HEAT repeat domain-containing protein [Verrucomicrobiae bacterium]
MTTFYCANCWREVPESATICPHCGDDMIARQARSDFVDKLIAALRHPEPLTPMRAAWILGERRERQAVLPLIETCRSADNVFLMVAVVEALGKIGHPQGLETLREAARHPNAHLRRSAELALARWKE